MIAEVKGARLLQGLRGRPAADLAALADIPVRVSHLAMHVHLAELDINSLLMLRDVMRQTRHSRARDPGHRLASNSASFKLSAGSHYLVNCHRNLTTI